MIRRRRKKRDKVKTQTPWRENLECLAAAIVMALVLKFFVIEAYKIPTGSMQPTLMGDDGSQIYDRILVDKFTYRLRDPARWEVVVFKYPLDLSKNYVKRLVGLPKERLAVADGNLWMTTDASADETMPGRWKILRKPVTVQGDLWKLLFDWDDPGKSAERARSREVQARGASSYRIEVANGSWRHTREGMVTKAGAPFRFVFPDGGRSVRDFYRHGYPPEVARALKTPGGPGGSIFLGKNRVGDLKLTLEATPDRQVEQLELVLRDYDRVHVFVLAGPAGKGPSRIIWNDRAGSGAPPMNPCATSDFRLAAGESYEISAEVCDQRLRLLVDGEEVARVTFDATWCEADRKIEIGPANGGWSGEGREEERDLCRVELIVPSGSLRLERIAVHRDIHYLPRHDYHKPYGDDWSRGFHPIQDEQAPEGCYFMMGDNTQNSLDSRGWQEIFMREESGREISGNFNGQRSSPDRNPRPLHAQHSGGAENPHFPSSEAAGDIQVLRTTAGFEHRVRGGSHKKHSPYVKRKYIIGKALVVFWPLQPFAAESRWKFIR